MPDTVTVSDAAKSLGVNLPRLMRYLKRPEFTEHVQQETRRTRTGTRTVTVVSISVLSDLKAAFASENGEQKQKHYHPEVLPSELSDQTKTYLAMLTARADERIQEQAATIADLRRDKDELREERKRLQAEVLSLSSELEALKQIAERVTASPGDTEKGASATEDEFHTGGKRAAKERQDSRKPFWRFWETRRE